MFKNLSTAALGVSGRPNELIEAVLTYGFKGFDLDVADLVLRNQNLQQIQLFLDSAKLKIGGFELPTSFLESETSLEPQLNELAEEAAKLGATRCMVNIAPISESLPYHENFEFHTKRLGEIGEILAKHEIALGVGFDAVAESRKDAQFQFISEVEPLLMLLKTAGLENVGLLLDLWHWQLGGGNNELLAGLTVKDIVSVRVADLPVDYDPKSITAEDRLLPAGEEGTIDFSSIFTLLAEMEYEGPVTIYPHPSKLAKSSRDVVVRQVSKLLDEVWKEAGLSKSGDLVVAAES